MHICDYMPSFGDTPVHACGHLPGSERKRAQKKITAREASQGVEGERVGRWGDRVCLFVCMRVNAAIVCACA